MSLQDALADLQSKVDTESHVGSWLQVTQEMIDAFADATRAAQWIHTDPVRARTESPFGGTIAHGYLSTVTRLKRRSQDESDAPAG